MQPEQKDLISLLPDEVLISIINFLPLRESARTSILSKRWRPLFHVLPNLVFDEQAYNLGYFWDVTILSVLHAREGFPINRCDVIFYGQPYGDRKRSIVRNICRYAVKELSLSYADIVPSSLFSCNSLVRLELMRCHIVLSRRPIALPHLKHLVLRRVDMEDGWLETNVPLFGSLEELVVKDDCEGVANFAIRSKSLLKLCFDSWYSMETISLEEATDLQEVEAEFDFRSDLEGNNYWMNEWKILFLLRFLSQIPSVETLSLAFLSNYDMILGLQPSRLPENIVLHNIKKLVMKMDITKVSTNYFLSSLLGRCSNLEELHVENSSGYVQDMPMEVISFWESQEPATVLAQRLTRATLKSSKDNVEHFLVFVRFLLENAKLMEKVIIQYKVVSEKLQVFKRSLHLQYPIASPLSFQQLK